MNARWEALRKAAQAAAGRLGNARVVHRGRGEEWVCEVSREQLRAIDAALAALEETAQSEAPDREALVAELARVAYDEGMTAGHDLCTPGRRRAGDRAVTEEKSALLSAWEAEVAALRAEVERLSKWNDVINRLNERVKAAEAALATERARALEEAGGFEGHPTGVCLEHGRFRLEGAGLIDTEGPLSLCTGCGQLPPHAGCQAICAACAPPNGTCYCAGCQVAGKASPPPAPAPRGEERCEMCTLPMKIHPVRWGSMTGQHECTGRAPRAEEK